MMEVKPIQYLDMERIPNHIAIIMDGNGRWAKSQGKDRNFGHVKGVDSVRSVLETSIKLGVKVLTLYTFSEENWQRPKEEVTSLMSLLSQVVYNELPDLMKSDVKLEAIGDIEALPEDSLDALQYAIEKTRENKGLQLILAINYSGRTEILRAVNRLRNDLCDVTEERFREALYNNISDPDLLIRTGGEFRISNFLLWQMAYTELYFTPVYWPAFREEELYKAIHDFQSRQRRFGKTGDQIEALS